MTSCDSNIVDVLIIGSGPAGHAAAVSVARNIHTTVVFDSQEYRNERVTHMHMVPTHDGRHPKDFRQLAKEDTTAHYDFVTFVDTKITHAKKSGELFVVKDTHGDQWTGRSLILATGGMDVMLDIPGFSECWARSIFHCLFCFGYEQRGSASSGILTADKSIQPALYVHVARNALQLCKTVTFYTNGDTSRTSAFTEVIGRQAAMKIDERRVARVKLGDNNTGITITLEDSSEKYEAFLAHNPEVKLRSMKLVEQLGLDIAPQGYIAVQSPFGESSVPGVFVAGDAATATRTIPQALATGASAASGAAGHVQSRGLGQMSVGDFLRTAAPNI